MQEGQPKILVTPGKHVNFVSRAGWEYVERPNITGIVAIIAVTDDGNILFVEQYRPPVDKRVIELPAGLAGDVAGHESEELSAAARRELLEETGYEARQMTQLTEAFSSAGITDELITLFRATGLRRVGEAAGDGNEQLVLHEVPLKSAMDWLRGQVQNGRGIDMKVFAGLYFAVGIERA